MKGSLGADYFVFDSQAHTGAPSFDAMGHLVGTSDTITDFKVDDILLAFGFGNAATAGALLGVGEVDRQGVLTFDVIPTNLNDSVTTIDTGTNGGNVNLLFKFGSESERCSPDLDRRCNALNMSGSARS
jgi:hypothetical protein